ncbi:DUF6349 family protein [Streptantibioticus ferralitis]|uniref:DUF6349 family protein n=1 Tax=Streptantibioticus ferralitis TaxID=236510 RepID=A0ABT5YZY2_9ACTN|nr:DUF6349 family protein [Streptantibioticus ferralitis]MDF2257152.1 DUF6349 family protein [Streptantibioticus ferralitis]
MTTPTEPVGAVARHTAYPPRRLDKIENARHLWRIAWGHPGFTHHTPPEPTPDHRPTVITRNWGKPAPGQPGPIWPYLHRGACLGCDWEGPDRRRTDEAVEDAHDHNHPEWRNLPLLPERRGRHWLTHAAHLYPENWFDNGGPIRTIRTGTEKRHLPGKAPGGGYDLAAQPPKTQNHTAAITETLPLEYNASEAA